MNQNKTTEKINVINGDSLILQDIESNPMLNYCIEELDNMPDSKDLTKVLDIKKKIENGTYDFDANLDSVVDALIDESSSSDKLALPLFESWFLFSNLR